MIDLEKLRSIYRFSRSLTLKDAQVLLKAAKTKTFEAGVHIIREGGLQRDIYLIHKGLVRAFTINDKGTEITTMLRWENQVFGSFDVILFDQPSRFYFETLEKTDVLLMNYDTLQDIISSNPKLEANRKFFFQKVLKQLLQRLDTFVLLTPEERYLHFVKTNPDIVNRVPNKYIANILGITPVSLSRIRQRIAARKK